MNEPFTSINAEAVNTEVQTFVKDAFSAHKKVVAMRHRMKRGNQGALEIIFVLNWPRKMIWTCHDRACSILALEHEAQQSRWSSTSKVPGVRDWRGSRSTQQRERLP